MMTNCRRDRFNGPTSEFKEKDGFKPNVKLEYIDDDGHVLSAKEAFRYLSHKFHGKGPGKNKVNLFVFYILSYILSLNYEMWIESCNFVIYRLRNE